MSSAAATPTADIRFHTQLQQARRRSGLTQQQLADHLKDALGAVVSQQAISEWERGASRPGDRNTVLALCQVLYRHGAFRSLAEIESFLRPLGQGRLYRDEIQRWLPELLTEDIPADSQPAPDQPSVSGAQSSEERISQLSQQFIAWLGRGIETLAQPAWRNAFGVVALCTILIGSAWRPPALWRNQWTDALWIVLAMWASSLLLAWPPSQHEADRTGAAWRQARLYRLGGTASGVFVTVGLLFFGAAFYQVMFQAVPPRWLNFLAAAVGAVFAFAGGLRVQERNSRIEDQDFMRKANLQITAFVFVAQAFLGWVLHAGHEFLATGAIPVIAVILFVLWPLVRRRKR